MERKAARILNQSGLCGKYSGYLYIIECIKFIKIDPSVLDRLCKELYVDVGRVVGVNCRCVERNMRYTINFLYKNGAFNKDPLLSIFSGQKLPPSNKTFLCLLVEHCQPEQ